MPEGFDQLRAKLYREVNEKHPDWSKERKDAYVYGTLRKAFPDWEPNQD